MPLKAKKRGDFEMVCFPSFRLFSGPGPTQKEDPYIERNNCKQNDWKSCFCTKLLGAQDSTCLKPIKLGKKLSLCHWIGFNTSHIWCMLSTRHQEESAQGWCQLCNQEQQCQRQQWHQYRVAFLGLLGSGVPAVDHYREPRQERRRPKKCHSSWECWPMEIQDF